MLRILSKALRTSGAVGLCTGRRTAATLEEMVRELGERAKSRDPSLKIQTKLAKRIDYVIDDIVDRHRQIPDASVFQAQDIALI